MARSTSTLLRLALSASAFALAAACGGSDPALQAAVTPAADPVQPRVAVSSFACTGMVAPKQVRERITGGLTALGEPVDVTFILVATQRPLVAGAEPALDPGFYGGYWKQHYGLDAWRVGSTDIADFTILLPAGPIPAPFRFEAMAIVDYTAGGQFQDVLACSTL